MKAASGEATTCSPVSSCYPMASVIVQRNDDGDEPAEPDTPAPTLVYVEGTGRADDVAAAAVAAGYELVRCEIRGSP
jgi:hypothetical protein